MIVCIIIVLNVYMQKMFAYITEQKAILSYIDSLMSTWDTRPYLKQKN